MIFHMIWILPAGPYPMAELSSSVAPKASKMGSPFGRRSPVKVLENPLGKAEGAQGSGGRSARGPRGPSGSTCVSRPRVDLRGPLGGGAVGAVEGQTVRGHRGTP